MNYFSAPKRMAVMSLPGYLTGFATVCRNSRNNVAHDLSSLVAPTAWRR